MPIFGIILAVLSIWDYPSRQLAHENLRRQFIAATRKGDAAKMEEVTRKGVELLPEDPTWRYNHACALAYYEKRAGEAFDSLEKAIDLGFRNAEAIAKDADLQRLRAHRRYAEIIEYAKEMQGRPLMFGPLATVPATGIFGKSIALGSQNLSWDLDVGAFVAKMKMAHGSAGGNVGDLYMNRDDGHSKLDVSAFPGLTVVTLDSEGHARGMDLDFPNIEFPYPVFGNASRAYTSDSCWRSLPRAMMTSEAHRLKRMMKFYLSNQIWVFPANCDTPPKGEFGDVFASVAPYWIVTEGPSYTDQPYLRAALQASRAFSSEVKGELVRRGLLAPTIQALMRKSLKAVAAPADYLTAKAHPTAFPSGGLDVSRFVSAASALKKDQIPPLAALVVRSHDVAERPELPELTYATAFAWAMILRAKDEDRHFQIVAKGASEFAFIQTHGNPDGVTINLSGKTQADVRIKRSAITSTNRIDIAVFGRNPGTDWGAPSFVSFAILDPKAPYCDPVLYPADKASSK